MKRIAWLSLACRTVSFVSARTF